MYFHPPEEIETEVFARLPDSLRVKDRQSGWAFGKGDDGLHSFLEGPSFDRAGNLYLVDIPYGRILRVSPEGNWDVVTEYDGWPNGLKIHRDGRIFIADHRRGIMQLDPATGGVAPILEYFRREGFKGVNDLVFASNGDLYFTDQGQSGLQDPTGRVLRRRDGKPALVNYRVKGSTYIVDRLFAAAELRHGEDPQRIVRITRRDAQWREVWK